MVSAATKALTIASSVAWTVAAKSGVRSVQTAPHGATVQVEFGASVAVPCWGEKARDLMGKTADAEEIQWCDEKGPNLHT